MVSIKEALKRADESGLDLIEISPNANPPVCKILDLGKYRYEQQKRKAEARKKIIALSEKYGLQVDPDAKIEDISVGMQQRVEILKIDRKSVV